MRMHTTWLLVLALALLLSAVPASAGVLYDNGPGDGTIGAWTINYGYAVSDSFDLSGDSTVTGVDLALWAYSGDTPVSVDWLITTGPFGPAVPGGSGTADLINGVSYSNGSYVVFQDNFAIPDLALGAGTYWLQLQNAVVDSSYPLFWEVNDGPSVAWENTLGNVANSDAMGPGTNSDTFQILGTSGAATPEPGSVLLLGSGLLLLASRLRRKART
jgi:hypothetical protein